MGDTETYPESMSDREWEIRKEVERRFAHAHRRRFGLNNTAEDRLFRDQMAFLASFIVTETVRTLDAWAGPSEVGP
jgi:hypothetical protein